jgi:hypothetical protein
MRQDDASRKLFVFDRCFEFSTTRTLNLKPDDPFANLDEEVENRVPSIFLPSVREVCRSSGSSSIQQQFKRFDWFRTYKSSSCSLQDASHVMSESLKLTYAVRGSGYFILDSFVRLTFVRQSSRQLNQVDCLSAYREPRFLEATYYT